MFQADRAFGNGFSFPFGNAFGNASLLTIKVENVARPSGTGTESRTATRRQQWRADTD
jgi:hypothetical protein